MTITFRAKTRQGWVVDSPLKRVMFPDGAVHISGAEDPGDYDYQVAWVQELNHTDYFTLAMWADVCRSRGERTVLVLPYLPGARMDRGTPTGSMVYALAIADLVNPDRVVTLDPHSPATENFWRDILGRSVLTVFPFERIIRREIQDASSDDRSAPYVGVIAPDAGAVDRASRAAKVMGVPVYRAEKTRDFDTGKLSGFHMVDELPSEGKLLVVDDICDGGGTFLGLAEATGLSKDRLDLWVTHGIFSKGFGNLLENFGKIYTTDSYCPLSGYLPETVHVVPLVKYLSADAVI